MPGYAEGNDAEAAAVYEKALPGSIVATVRTDGLITWLGSVHCVTKQLPLAVNSPSAYEFAIPNVTCAEVPGGAPSSSCDIVSVSDACRMKYMEDLQFAINEETCRLNALYFDLVCCSSVEEWAVATLPESIKNATNTILVEVYFGNDTAVETVWLIREYESNTIVAASPIILGMDLEGDPSTIEIELPEGIYEFVLFDLSGDGIASDTSEAGYIYVDNLTTGEYWLYFNGYFQYHVNGLFLIDEIVPLEDRVTTEKCRRRRAEAVV